MVRGFLLNNQLTDFAFVPSVGGAPVANRPEPGKRPRSSMAPTLVFDESGRLVLAIGSPGGPRIISYVAQTLFGVLDGGLDLQAAIDQPRIVAGAAVELERDRAPPALAAELGALGHPVVLRELESGLNGIQVTGRGLAGGADRRREGVARGE
jgi:gamma-glutamyltranspeptidase/glutathione hydrolase